MTCTNYAIVGTPFQVVTVYALKSVCCVGDYKTLNVLENNIYIGRGGGTGERLLGVEKNRCWSVILCVCVCVCVCVCACVCV